MNQKSKMLILVLIIVAFIMAGLIFMNSRFNRAIEQGQTAVEQNREAIFSQPGFSDPKEEWKSEAKDDSGKVQMISEAEFKLIENPTECTALHWDMQGEEMASFAESHMDDWYAGDWEMYESSVYNVGEGENTETYYSLRKSFLLFDKITGTDIPWEVEVNYDAVSGRLHSMGYSLPNKENMRMAFVDIMEQFGEDKMTGGEMFDKVFKGLKTLEGDKYIFYEQDGYKLYMAEQDYFTGMKKNKKYWMSISPSI